MKHLLRLLCVSLLAAHLVACGGMATRPDLPPRPQRESILGFALEGRAAFSQAGRASSIRISWEHTPDADLIGFASPLGSQLAELQRDPRGARLITPDGERYEARSPDQLLARLTETPIPLDSLALWVLGRVGPHAIHLQRDTAGRLQQAEDGAWTIRITAYESEQPNALPILLEIEGQGMRVKLAVEAWQL